MFFQLQKELTIKDVHSCRRGLSSIADCSIVLQMRSSELRLQNLKSLSNILLFCVCSNRGVGEGQFLQFCADTKIQTSAENERKNTPKY